VLVSIFGAQDEARVHIPETQYSEQELNDGQEIIAWLASQSWSSGSVGIYGKSYSGFNGIQLAMRNPPALKAIITVDSTDQLYAGDCTYSDGVMNMGDGYNFGIDAHNAYSPSPNFPTDEKTLNNRFDNPPWSLLWMKHQRDDAFWHEPVKSLEAIHIPVFLIGGFVDEYRDVVPRFLAEVKSPVRAIVGPWGHDYPHDAELAPDIEWRDLAVRWWDQWLKGKDTGVMSEPQLAVYMRHYYPPDPTLAEIPGEWRSANSWPPEGQQIQPFFLQSNRSLTSDSALQTGVDSLKYVPSAGIDAGSELFDLQPDQRPFDAFSLVYDSAPFEKETAILGSPEVRLRASATAPQADWFVRLSDVAPDGSVTLITDGGLNGAQRDSMSDPQDMEPNKVYSIQVAMRFTSWVFPVGHRSRLSVSNARWPMFWPTPYAMTTSLFLGGQQPSRLLLPTVPVAGALPVPHFKLIAKSEPSTTDSSTPGSHSWWTLQRTKVGPIRVEFGTKNVWARSQKWPWGIYYLRSSRIYEVDNEHPEAASLSGSSDLRLQLSYRQQTWHSEWNLRSDTKNFYYLFRRELKENGKLIREKEWKETIPRDHQ
jgi:predicted acyl esterase